MIYENKWRLYFFAFMSIIFFHKVDCGASFKRIERSIGRAIPRIWHYGRRPYQTGQMFSEGLVSTQQRYGALSPYAQQGPQFFGGSSRMASAISFDQTYRFVRPSPQKIEEVVRDVVLKGDDQQKIFSFMKRYRNLWRLLNPESSTAHRIKRAIDRDEKIFNHLLSVVDKIRKKEEELIYRIELMKAAIFDNAVMLSQLRDDKKLAVPVVMVTEALINQLDKIFDEDGVADRIAMELWERSSLDPLDRYGSLGREEDTSYSVLLGEQESKEKRSISAAFQRFFYSDKGKSDQLITKMAALYGKEKKLQIFIEELRDDYQSNLIKVYRVVKENFDLKVQALEKGLFDFDPTLYKGFTYTGKIDVINLLISESGSEKDVAIAGLVARGMLTLQNLRMMGYSDAEARTLVSLHKRVKSLLQGSLTAKDVVFSEVGLLAPITIEDTQKRFENTQNEDGEEAAFESQKASQNWWQKAAGLAIISGLAGGASSWWTGGQQERSFMNEYDEEEDKFLNYTE